jgi:hypothetical protein
MDVITLNKNAVDKTDTGRFPFNSEMVCYSILWVKTVASEVIKKELIEELLARNDIQDARYTTSGPLCLVVKYDGLMTSPSQVQALVNRPGLEAVIVGC